MSIEEAVKAIRENESNRAQVIETLYKDVILRKSICTYVKNQSGTQEEAELVFDDVIVQFVKTGFSDHSSQLKGELNPYLMGIAKNLWYAELKKKSKIKNLDLTLHLNHELSEDQPEVLFLNQERYKVLKDLLDQLRSKCKNVLMYWANGYNMIEIAEKLNYQSEGMARKKKSQCFKELMDYLQSNPMIKNQLR
ncbi:MAG: sigma-70 family RNA polymerase sigma factor [Saprospiraceae bacterium]|nr:sigma-70 family RNA polymerase sigma factor [Saprospiraceae bacterium]HRG32133.1 sigma-70 family RNA polymerase sigma factor [Saprospiraceae bacterium]